MAKKPARNDKNPGARGRGRPKGSKNKASLEVKEAMRAAFEGLGGVPRLMKWANTTVPIYGPAGSGKEHKIIGYKGNLGAFYALWSKLIPVELRGVGEDGRINIHLTSDDASL